MKVFVSAGEASGDALGAALLEELTKKVPTTKAFGMGGPRMRALGFEAFRDSNSLGVVGLLEVLRHLPRLFRLKDELADYAIEQKPDLAVLIDVPDFNIRLAKRLKQAGIPVVFYVGPSVWAWRPGRAKKYARYIDALLVLFPFELPIWKKYPIEVTCVGHPLIDEISQTRHEPIEKPRTVALLPGSRNSEIRRHLPTLLDAAKKLRDESSVERFVLPVAPTINSELLSQALRENGLTENVELIKAEAGNLEPKRKAIRESLVALVASGTATLEVALLGVPQIVVYRVHWLTWLLMRPLVKLRFLSLVNLIGEREIVPELLQKHFNVDNLFSRAKRLLSSDEERRNISQQSQDIRMKLGATGAAERAADTVIELHKTLSKVENHAES